MSKYELVAKMMSVETIFVTPFGESKNETEFILELPVMDIEAIHMHPYNPVTKNMRDNPAYFCYIWGGPGPDRNFYLFRDYGKTWAFSRKELENKEN